MALNLALNPGPNKTIDEQRPRKSDRFDPEHNQSQAKIGFHWCGRAAGSAAW